MARVAEAVDPGGGDEISSKDIQKKLEELMGLAQKMTPKEMLILSELKKADTGLNQQKPKNQRMMRGGSRMHPYDNGNSNRARPPRGGPGRGQMNNRPFAHDGFGPMMDNRSRVPFWQNQPQPWGPGAPVMAHNQIEQWRFDERNHQMPRVTQMEPNQREMWGPGGSQRETWGPCSESNFRDFRGPQLDPNPQEKWNLDIESNMIIQRGHNPASQLGKWKSSLESNQRGPGLDPNRQQRWRSGSNQRNKWAPSLDRNQQGQRGPGLEPNRQRDPAWPLDLDPIPTFPVELPSRPQQPSQTEIGKDKTPLQQRSFVDDNDDCGFGSHPAQEYFRLRRSLGRQTSQETAGPRNSQESLGSSRPSFIMGQPRLQPLMSIFDDLSNFQFKTLDELQRAQQHQQQQRAQQQQQIQQFCPPWWSHGNHF